MGALHKLTHFVQTSKEHIPEIIPSLFVLIKASTSSFKESNFNVAKAILLFFFTLFSDVYETMTRTPDSYLVAPAIKLAVEKISDRKLAEASISCLNSLCVVKDPQKVIALSIKYIAEIKSSPAHEALLSWFNSFCVNFGANILSDSIQDILGWIQGEIENNNIKVKKAALNALGELYSQLGPALEAFVKSKNPSAGALSSIQRVFAESKHDPSTGSVTRTMRCITLSAEETSSSSSKGLVSLSVPASDLTSLLKKDCLSRMATTDGKNSWKMRKDAMEEVAQQAEKCCGLLATDAKAYVTLKEIMIALRCRMNDSQSNLKPLAATTMASILSRVDDSSQAKFAKIVFPSLCNAAMNDMKKTMRDASVSALKAGTQQSEQNGGKVNSMAVDALIVSLQSELSDAAIKSSGLPDVLTFLIGLVESIHQVDTSPIISNHVILSKIIIHSILSSKGK